MKAWIAHHRDGRENGAVLVFAPSHKEAKPLAFAAAAEFGDFTYIEMRVYLLPQQEIYLKHCDGHPGATTYIPRELVCPDCDHWGTEMHQIGEDPLCLDCYNAQQRWRE